ncbi:MAG: phenylacetate--CoA ligase [Candidatus Hydrogenedens sp.]|nr:phenylacetate--CoA ligase [Candidatus Hydrogenedentota bacterium]NLF58208.1 phenylacetate--CoA ligase [Candidatus Hydrogenedens sp.]
MSEFLVENRIFDPDEVLPRRELAELQLRRLRETVARAARVPFYAETFKKNGITPDSIKSLDDLRRLPFTGKSDMRDNYPLGLCAVPRAELARIHGSSGTTGMPTFVGYTKKDLDIWAGLCARFLVAGGLRPEHTVQVSFGYGLFTGGFGLHYGIEKVGAAIIPAASGNTTRQIMLMRDLQPDALICTPSYALNIAEVCRSMDLDPHELSLKYAHFGGEMWTEDMRREIERELGLLAFNNYGLSEIIGPGVSGECAVREGMHLQEDHFLVECLDPETLEPVEDYAYGELVITALTREAMPMLRYRTRDIAALDPCPCPCGRTGRRMSRVMGRTDDMLIIRGVNVFPSQIEEALLAVEGTAPHYLIEINRPAHLDEVTVKVEVEPRFFSDKMSEMQALRERIDRKIQAYTGIHAHVELVAPKTIERSAGKAVRVVDNRGAKA